MPSKSMPQKNSHDFKEICSFQEEFKLDFCFEGKDSGKGDAKQPRWYYDHEDGVCKNFIYGGKEGNRNRFLTRQSCEASCFNAQDVCTLPKVKET